MSDHEDRRLIEDYLPVWDPLSEWPELVRIYHPVQKFDYAEREIVAARFYEILAETVNQAAEENP